MEHGAAAARARHVVAMDGGVIARDARPHARRAECARQRVLQILESRQVIQRSKPLRQVGCSVRRQQMAGGSIRLRCVCNSSLWRRRLVFGRGSHRSRRQGAGGVQLRDQRHYSNQPKAQHSSQTSTVLVVLGKAWKLDKTETEVRASD